MEETNNAQYVRAEPSEPPTQAWITTTASGISKEQKKQLDRKFSKKQIKQVKKGKAYLDYVSGADVISRLNNVFDCDWDFEVVNHTVDLDNDYILVHGRLTVRGITKEQFGGTGILRYRSDHYSKANQPLDVGNDVKIATTDALKKCATLFGVALHLYNPTEDPISPPQPEAPMQRKKAEPFQVKAIKSLMKLEGRNESELLKVLDIKNFGDLDSSTAEQLMQKKHIFWEK